MSSYKYEIKTYGFVFYSKKEYLTEKIAEESAKKIIKSTFLNKIRLNNEITIKIFKYFPSENYMKLTKKIIIQDNQKEKNYNITAIENF